MSPLRGWRQRLAVLVYVIAVSALVITLAVAGNASR